MGCSAPALALYLLLVTVADADGLSWYSEPTLCRMLSCDAAQLRRDRAELQQAGLIAYRKPLYQVLDLAPAPVAVVPELRRGCEPVALGDILKSILPACASTANSGGVR